MTPAGGDDAGVVARLVEELQALSAQQGLEITLNPGDAFGLLACLQLAWRHPNLTPGQKRLIKDFASWIEPGLRSAPTVMAVLADGWDPAKDRPTPVAGVVAPGLRAVQTFTDDRETRYDVVDRSNIIVAVVTVERGFQGRITVAHMAAGPALLAALAHVQSCRFCSESDWSRCGGREALDAMDAARRLP